VGDIIGLPNLDVEAERTDFLPPRWFPGEKDERPTALFLDEINRARPDVQAVLYPLLAERRVGVRKLPDSTVIIAAGNPDNLDDYETAGFNDSALKSRLCFLSIESGANELLEYGRYD